MVVRRPIIKILYGEGSREIYVAYYLFWDYQACCVVQRESSIFFQIERVHVDVYVF